jgi:PAS domain S-box-containing protein
MSLRLPLPRSGVTGAPDARGAAHSPGGRLKRWLAGLRISRWTIGVRIAAIVLTLALPLNLVILAVVWDLASASSEAQRTSLLYTSRSIARAADAELGKYMALAQALSRSPALLDSDIGAFGVEARRAFASIEDAVVLVADAEGRELMNTASQPGQPLPLRHPAAIAAQKRALETGAIGLTDVIFGPVVDDWIVNIEVPIFKNGQPFRALAVLMKAKAYLRLLNDQQIPQNWLAGIADRQGRFIAHVPAHSLHAGRLASESWRKVMAGDGVFQTVSLEGDPIMLANAHTAKGWSVGVAVKKAQIQAATWNTIRWAALLGGGISALSLLFALVISRRITGPIAELQRKAPLLLSDPRAPTPKGLPELEDLSEALRQSALDRNRSERALRESEERFRGIFEHAATGIAITDLKGRFLLCNPAYLSMVGCAARDIGSLRFQDLVDEKDAEANTAQLGRLFAREIPSFEIVSRFVTRSGKGIWVHKHLSLLKDAAGEPASIVVLVTDITERKRYEEHIELLLHEVNHRSKNLLALVQAVARQTSASSPNDFVARFGERIQAMAAAQDLLVKNEWRGVDLDGLVRSQLAHFVDLIGTRIEIGGPALLLSASAAQALGMALHELATNAGKYGSLSNADGHVSIEWSIEAVETGRDNFVIGWTETGGPAVQTPQRSGFGTTVICGVTASSLDGKADFDLPPEGLKWRLECRASEVLESGRPAFAARRENLASFSTEKHDSA